MHSSVSLMLSRWTLTLLASLALTACGGGGGGNNDSGGSKPSTPPPVEQPTPPGIESPGTEPPETTPPDAEKPGTEPPVVRPPDVELPEQPPVTLPPVSSRISQALVGGDSRLLQDEDRAPLLQTATDIVAGIRAQQRALVAKLLDDSTAATLDFGNNSQTVSPLLSSSASPLRAMAP